MVAVAFILTSSCLRIGLDRLPDRYPQHDAGADSDAAHLDGDMDDSRPDADADGVADADLPGCETVFVAGYLAGTVDYGGGVRSATPTGGADAATFVVALDGATGAYAWDAVFQGAASWARMFLTTHSDRLLAFGAFTEDCDLGGGSRAVDGTVSNYVVALGEADGSYMWDYSGGDDRSAGHAVAPDGTTLAVHSFLNSDDFGGGSRTNPGDWSLAVVAISAGGSYLWDSIAGGDGYEFAEHMARAPDGTLYIVGIFEGETDFGGGRRRSEGREDMFVVALEPDGAYRWDRVFGGTRDDAALRVGVADDGGLRIGGRFESEVDFGGGAHTARDTAGVLVALDADGAYLWDRTVEATTYASIDGLVVGTGGRAWVVGEVEGTYDLGSGTRTTAGRDGFLWAVTADGTSRWDYAIASAADDRATDVAASPGVIHVAGDYSDEIDLGGGPRPGAGPTDVFVVALRDTDAL